MSKGLGYGLMIAGLAIIALRLLFQKTLANIPALASISPTKTLIISATVGIVLIILGATMSGGDKKPKDVPIYDKTGKHVVGYRQTK